MIPPAAIETAPATERERRTYIIRGGVPGRERLRVLAVATAPSTAALLDRVGVPQGGRCLDVGCGGGDVALELAARVGPLGEVVGIDADEEKLHIAAAEAAGAGRNVSYRRVDVMAEELGQGFDIAYMRFLLTHVSDPGRVCARLRRALRPGGVAIVEDIDHRASVCYPENEAFARYCEIYSATARARGGDPHIGARLPELLRAAGFADIAVSSAQPLGVGLSGVEGSAKLICALTMESIGEAAIAEGVAERAEVQAVTAALHRLARDGSTLMSMPRVVQAWGRRPA